jgi:uncharacterized protein (TIGR02145 family)
LVFRIFIFKSFKSFYTVLFILLCIPYLYSQDITNIRFEQEGKKVNIYYDITGAKGMQKFDIKIFCSEDDGQTWGNPLKSVTGAVGKNRTAGYNKKITWDVLADREKLTGDIKFRIKAIIAGSFEGNSGIFSDSRDRKKYKWVRIGTQIWMAENLNYYTSTDSWCYDNKSSNCKKYDRLYNWKTAKKVCPDGWHLPTDAEWTTLTDYLGGESLAGGKLKETGTTHWDNPNTGTTNESGFTGLPGGYRYGNGTFHYIGSDGYWWSSTEYSSTTAWYQTMYYSLSYIFRYNYHKEYGFSVRCVRDY